MDNQGILYSLICQADGTTVLAEYQRAKGTHGMNAKKVLGSVQRANNERKSFSHQRLCYNIQMDAQGTVYMCVTEEGFSRVTAFNFLDAIKKSCGPLKNGGQSPLYAQLKRETDFFSDPKNDKVNKIRTEIDQVKDVMIENIDKIIERGEKIDTLVDKAGGLEQQSSQFKSNATTLKRKMLWKKILLIIVVVLVVALAIFLGVLFGCSEDGVNFKKCQH